MKDVVIRTPFLEIALLVGAGEEVKQHAGHFLRPIQHPASRCHPGRELRFLWQEVSHLLLRYDHQSLGP